MTMSCERAGAILDGERDDDLSADESANFIQHLESCPNCSARLATAEAEVALLAAPLIAPAVSESAWARVDASVREGVRGAPPGREEAFGDASIAPRPIAIATPAVAAPKPAPAAIAMPSRRTRFAPTRRARGGLLMVIVAAAAAIVLFSILGHAPPPPPDVKSGPDYTDKPWKKRWIPGKDGHDGFWLVDNDPVGDGK